jgi:hypothetical protein
VAAPGWKLLAESLRIAHQIDDRVAQFYLLDAFGCHAALSGQARLAARLFGAADTMRTGVGANVMPFLAPSLAHAEVPAAAALRLVADGLTNKQIGTRLFISERTVDSHVRGMLNKLGFNSRAQIAAWMAAPNQ